MGQVLLLPLLGLAAALGLSACSDGSARSADARVVASGQTGQRAFGLANFDRVTLRGPDSVEVRVGPAFSVVARGDTGVLKALEIVTDGNALKIGRKHTRGGFSWGDDDHDNDQYVRVLVTMPAIRGAVIAGSGDMKVDRIAGDGFEGAVAGSGDLDLGGMAVKAADLSIAGSGDLKAAGTADRVKLSIAGSGDAEAGALAAKAADVSIAGSGNARLSVDGEASVSIVGSGDVDLGAKARCTKSLVGSGEVTCGG